MPTKNSLAFLLLLSFLIQILFSIYYSSEIINQNSNYLILQEKVDSLEIERQTLQAKLATETSLEKLSQYLQGKNYQPIWQQIDLNQP